MLFLSPVQSPHFSLLGNFIKHLIYNSRKRRTNHIFFHMSVESTHPSILSPQILFNNRLRRNLEEGNRNMHMYGGIFPLAVSGTSTAAATDWFPVTDSVKSESGVSYITPISRKRLRDDSINFAHSHCFQNRQTTDQSEIDCFISGHMQKVAMGMEEKRRNHSRQIITAVEEIISKKLRGKEDEIEKINRQNSALEEKVKSLCVENQIWRELAYSNEATANALRSNLEQLLDQNHRCRIVGANAAASLIIIDDEEEAESCCGSGGMDHGNRVCKRCGKEESSLLFLPCRHLCVCKACGHLVEFCPLCNCPKNGTIHVVL